MSKTVGTPGVRDDVIEMMVRASLRAPVELADRPQWVVYRNEERDGRSTKMPYTLCASPANQSDMTTPLSTLAWSMTSAVPTAIPACGPPSNLSPECWQTSTAWMGLPTTTGADG